jgi:hypothetical protein
LAEASDLPGNYQAIAECSILFTSTSTRADYEKAMLRTPYELCESAYYLYDNEIRIIDKKSLRPDCVKSLFADTIRWRVDGDRLELLSGKTVSVWEKQ